MKNFKVLILIILLGGVFMPGNISGQCDSEGFLDECVPSLDTYTFIKKFPVSIKRKKSENMVFSYVFSKGSTYKMIVCDQNNKGEKMIINFYDRNRKLIASTYSKKNREHHEVLLFPCTATGVYYIEGKFEGSGGGCGVCILGFDKS